MLLVFGVLPALLLAAYPIRILRSLLLINRLSGRFKVALNIFVEKFYSCYRDGLDGGKDMRSFASLHLIIQLLFPLLRAFIISSIVIFFGGCCLLILLLKPCKKKYMNNIDACILALIALNFFQINKIEGNSVYSNVHLWSLIVTICFPLFITYGSLCPKKFLTKLKAKANKFYNNIMTLCNFSNRMQEMYQPQNNEGNLLSNNDYIHYGSN